MKTNFFTEIAKLGNGQISFTITTSDNQMAISLLPIDNTINDKGIKQLKPLSAVATPEELDEQFFETIQSPIIQTKKFISNAGAFLEQKKIAENESQMNKDKKEKADKKIKELKDLMAEEKEIKTNKPKIVKLIAEIKLFDSANSYAQKCQQKLAELESEQKELF